MTRVKICGITNQEDAQFAVEAGADALGFILVPGTPRYVGNRPDVLAIARSIPFVAAVAVVSDPASVNAEALEAFSAVQFYEGSMPERRMSRIRALRVRDESVLDEIAALEGECEGFVLDAYHPAKLGGSGETFDWDLAREAVSRSSRPIILAGGLTPENVAGAVAAVRPFAVDVSSGVETEPGRKDPAKVLAFVHAVRVIDATLA